MSESPQDLPPFPLVEPLQLGYLALGVLPVDLNCTRNEEVLLLARSRLPVVRLGDGHGEAGAARGRAILSLLIALRRRRRIGKRLDARQLLHVPRLANAEAAIVVLARLVHAHAAGGAHGDDDQARLLVLGRSIGRRRRGGVLAIFLDANVCDIALGQLPVRVQLGEARLDDAALFILEALCPRHAWR